MKQNKCFVHSHRIKNPKILFFSVLFFLSVFFTLFIELKVALIYKRISQKLLDFFEKTTGVRR